MRGPSVPGDRQRRFANHFEAKGAHALDHDAVREGRTIFSSRVVAPEDAPRLLISGQNNSKIGRIVTVGDWKGYPLYTLTLEERATCATSCHHYASCMGNSMHWPRRHKHGPMLEAMLWSEIAVLQNRHAKGFVVRLHILGDFYSPDYVAHWRAWLSDFPALHVFGFTARSPFSPIGRAVMALREDFPDRFCIRWSMPASSFDDTISGVAITIPPGAPVPKGAFACPAQKKDEKCCARCAACWQSTKAVAFIEHGNAFAGRPPARERALAS